MLTTYSVGVTFMTFSMCKTPKPIPPKLRGMMIWSNLYSCALHCAGKIPKETLKSENGAQSIIIAVLRRDPLPFFSTVQSDFTAVLYARRADNESFKAFESRFEGALLRFRGHRNDINVAESFLALMLFKGSRVEAKQRVGILSASVA